MIVDINHNRRPGPARRPARRSARAMEVAAMFGLSDVGLADFDRLELGGPREEGARRRIEVPLPRGGVVYVTGASGGGKSTLLRRLRAALPRGRAIALPSVARQDRDRPAVDLAGETLEDAFKRLARAGLADARVMLTPVGRLSEGERARLRLALLMARLEDEGPSRDGRVILADEFLSTVDRVAAKVVARRFARWVRSTTRHTLVAATAQEDLLGALRPEAVVEVGWGKGGEARRHEGGKARGHGGTKARRHEGGEAGGDGVRGVAPC